LTASLKVLVVFACGSVSQWDCPSGDPTPIWLGDHRFHPWSPVVLWGDRGEWPDRSCW